MERVNYVERAKRIMAQTVRTGALVIMPLAAAVQLQASITSLPNGSPTCAVNFGNGAQLCNGGAPESLALQATALPNSFLTGVDLNFSGGWADGPPSGGRWASTWTATFSARGNLSGSLSAGQILPLDYNFSLYLPGTGWGLEFELGNSGTPALYGSQTFSGSQSGSGSMILNTDLADGSPLIETVVLSFTGIDTDNTHGTPNFGVTSPDFEFDGIPTPEPGSVGLIAAGLGFFAWLFRRRRVGS